MKPYGASKGLSLLTVGVCLFTLAPMALSVCTGVLENASQGLRAGFTLRWVEQVGTTYGSTIIASLGLAVACVGCCLVLGLPLAYVLARHPGRWTQVLEECLTLPVAVPGLATALALILAYGHIQGLRQSYAFILAGHVVFTLPFLVRTVSAAFASEHLRSLEEAARTLGAGFPQRFLGVLAPCALPSILAGCLMVFTLSVGEFNLTWMLHTPYTRTLPVGLADSYASMRLEVGSAYTLMFFIVVLPVLWAMQAISAAIERTYANS
ncbi:ABC transporter permease [Megalodesulfovibrio paquesii]